MLLLDIYAFYAALWLGAFIDLALVNLSGSLGELVGDSRNCQAVGVPRQSRGGYYSCSGLSRSPPLPGGEEG